MKDNVKGPLSGMNFLHASGTISIPNMRNILVGDIVHLGIIPKYLKDVAYKPVIISRESNGGYYSVVGRIVIEESSVAIVYEDGGTTYAFAATDSNTDDWEFSIPE